MTPVGVEPTIAWMKARSPRPLDEGAVSGYFIRLLSFLVAFGLKVEGFSIKTIEFK